MREIRFRAWYKPTKQMVLPDKLESINFDTKVLGVYLSIENKGFNKLRLSDFILMQYTGLKDKNGKEIYEGDIIACKFYHPFAERINWEQVDIVGKVFWDLCGFSLNARNAEDDRRYPDLVDLNRNESEVIGNIYDNPELLEVKP